jgi:hypothetical protein
MAGAGTAARTARSGHDLWSSVCAPRARSSAWDGQPVTHERNRRGATDAQLKAVMKSANQPPGGWAGRQVGEEKGR